MTTETQAKPIFAATLRPHRSLGPKGFGVVVGLAALMAAIPGLVFFSIGAWPIVGFMGLDVIAIAWALSVSMRGGKVSEVVTLWPDALELKRIDAKGNAESLQFNPFFVKFVIDRDINERTTALWLKTKDEKVPLGTFLNPEDKVSFAKAFGMALKRARG